VGTEKDRCAVVAQLHHAFEGLAGECAVAHGERLVDDQQLRVHAGGHRERQADEHAAGVRLDRLVDELPDVRKGQDLVQPRVDLGPRQAEQGRVEVDVLDAGEIRIEARPQFQQRCDPASDLEFAFAGSQRAAHQLQQGGLPSAVAAHDAENLSGVDPETDIAYRPVTPARTWRGSTTGSSADRPARAKSS
jgi:hypothetical protein